MKVFGLDRNLLLGRSPLLPQKATLTHLLMRPDSSVINSGKHIYLPPHLTDMRAFPVIAFRLDRVGKFVDPAFASRYIKEISVGIALFDRKGVLQSLLEGLDPSPFCGFDGALILDHFSALSQIPDRGWGFVAGEESRDFSLPPATLAYSYVVLLSQYFMLKMGDLIIIPLLEETFGVVQEDNIYVSLAGNEIAYVGIR